MHVGGGLFFDKVVGFKPAALLENGLLCVCVFFFLVLERKPLLTSEL